MWPRKKLFPWQASLSGGLNTRPGYTRTVGSVPLQNPRIYNNPEYGQPDQWEGGAGSVMDNILNELRNPGEVVLQPNQSPILTNPNDPYSVKQPDWNPSGGKYSYLENLKGASPPTAPAKKKGQTAEEKKAEQQEALKLAMEDAAKYSGAMQGKTIPGVPPGGGSREHQMSVYNTGGYDLTSNRPISDTDAVRKRLYGIMGFGR